jgi:hypothetical protein
VFEALTFFLRWPAGYPGVSCVEKERSGISGFVLSRRSLAPSPGATEIFCTFYIGEKRAILRYDSNFPEIFGLSVTLPYLDNQAKKEDYS